MNAQKLENFIVLVIALGLAFIIWVILYRPQWLLWIFTLRG